ncbi:MAG: glycosyltransferase family 39 protein [Chloroflexi bacterium]|nr:glycosyltransferase family 39 protein [Chloroflexota bacterium]
MKDAVAPPAAAGGLTIRVDTLLWLGLIAAAAALRLARLDALPFTFEESARALDALRVSQDSVPEGWNGDLAAVVTSYLFRAFEGSELVARVGPAVAGSVMVAAVWLGGRGLGRVGALTAGALLAFSPLALLLSRSALPFSFGGLLAVAMAVALLSYLREPRAHTAFLFAAAFGLAFSADAVATTAAIAVAAFLLLDPIVARRGAVARAWGVFRRSPAHWLSVLLVLAAVAELAVTHFGTFLDLSQPAGLALWRDMLALPRDAREPWYQMTLLLAYDWPVLLAGGSGIVFFAQRLARRGFSALTSAQRFVLLWAVVAGVVVGLASQREAGQTLILIVPLALLGGLLAEEYLQALNWAALRRWWPAVAVALVLLAYAALMTTIWAEKGASGAERFYLVMALGGAMTVLAGCYSIMGRDASVIGITVVAAVAFAFLAHTDLSLTRADGAAEFAVDARTTERIEQFREVVDQFVASRAGPVLIDPALAGPLAWYLRDVTVTFAEPEDDASAVVVPVGREVDGFTTASEVWRLGGGWYPTDLDILPLWRWLVFREAYGNLNSMQEVEAQILVPTP